MWVSLVTSDEIPLVMSEFIENATRMLQQPSKPGDNKRYERALILMQKAHGIMNVISLNNCSKDGYFGFIVFVNMAVCY